MLRAVLSFLVLALMASLAFAVDTPPNNGGAAPQPTTRLNQQPAHAMLQLSPMYAEIRDSLAVSDARQKQLLVDLAAATDEPAAAAIVRELEALPLERVLAILRIQLRYATQENRVELQREIRLRMVELEAAGNI